MIWCAGTGVFVLPSSSGLPTDYIMASPDKAGEFPSFYKTTKFLASSAPSPSSETFSSASSPYWTTSDTFPPASNNSYPPYEGSLVVFTKLSEFQCASFTCLCLRDLWDLTVTSLSYFFFSFLGSDVFREANLAQLSCWGGHIYSERWKENDIEHPRIDKIMIYHV